MARAPRPTLTLPILGYALVDVAGMVLFALGGLYFSVGPGAVFAFPSSFGEALVTAVGGVALMLWASAQIVRQLLKQMPPPEPPPGG